MSTRALDVWRSDEEIDTLYGHLIEDLVQAMHKHPKRVAVGTHLMFIAKNIERVGDHAANIAETVQYQVTGEFVETGHPRPDPSRDGPERYFEIRDEENRKESVK